MSRSAGWDQVLTFIEGDQFAEAAIALQSLTTHASKKSERVYYASRMYKKFGIEYDDLAHPARQDTVADRVVSLGADLWNADFDSTAVAAFREGVRLGSVWGKYVLADALQWLGDPEGALRLEEVARSDSTYAQDAAALLAFDRIQRGAFTDEDVTGLRERVAQLEAAKDSDDESDLQLYQKTLDKSAT